VWRRIVRATCVTLGLAAAGAGVCVCASCTAPGSPGTAAKPGRPVITVGSFNFPESVLLAYLYAGALEASGYPVRVLPDLGSRELVEPALMTGLVQVVPEYAGSALEFVSLGQVHATASVTATASALGKWMGARGVVVARPAPAENANAIVVTAGTAARYRLHDVSGLAAVAPKLIFGGPPECPERLYCLAGLRRVYGLRFRSFVGLDAGGPLTRQALLGGDIGVALLFTTDPAIRQRHLVVLADNRGLQPAENVVPVLRRATARRYGAGLVATLNAVSARLSTSALLAMDAQVELGGRGPDAVAGRWLHEQGLSKSDQGLSKSDQGLSRPRRGPS
jgi:osmoprotectant transport system substrate-binding protein